MGISVGGRCLCGMRSVLLVIRRVEAKKRIAQLLLILEHQLQLSLLRGFSALRVSCAPVVFLCAHCIAPCKPSFRHDSKLCALHAKDSDSPSPCTNVTAAGLVTTPLGIGRKRSAEGSSAESTALKDWDVTWYRFSARTDCGLGCSSSTAVAATSDCIPSCML